MDDIDGEIWLPVLNYETIYQVSNYGRVKSLERPRSKACNAIRDKVIKQSFRGLYLKVDISDYSHIPRTISVHRLIGVAFVDNFENKPQINHIDGVKTHNWALNLEWNTRVENAKHASKLGLLPNQKGESHSQSKLTHKEVLEIFNSDIPPYTISEKYQVSPASIYDIRKGRKWSHITGMKKPLK